MKMSADSMSKAGPGRPAEIHSLAVFSDGAAMARVGAVAVATPILLAVVPAGFSRFDSGVSVWVIPTSEEPVIAQHTLALIRPSPI